MKSQLRTPAFLILAGTIVLTGQIAAATAGEDRPVKVGQTEAEVRQAMGMPKGIILMGGGTKVLSYDRGDITLEKGKVSRVELLPGQKTWQGIALENKVKFEEKQGQKRRGGQEILEEMVTSTRYKDSPAADQMYALQKLKLYYPSLNITPQMEEATRKLEKEREDLKREDIERERQKILEEGRRLRRQEGLNPVWVYSSPVVDTNGQVVTPGIIIVTPPVEDGL